MELSSILGLPLGLMTGAQFLTLMAEALKDRRQPEAQAATVASRHSNRCFHLRRSHCRRSR